MGILKRAVLAAFLLAGCEQAVPTEEVRTEFTGPIVEHSWDRVHFGTYDNAEFARFFTEIGGYSIEGTDQDLMSLRQGEQGASIWLRELPQDAPKARPPDAQSWEAGCYWSLMMRAKDIPSIVEDAEAS